MGVIALHYKYSIRRGAVLIIDSIVRSSGAVRVAHMFTIVVVVVLCPFMIVNAAEHAFYPRQGHGTAECSLNGAIVSADVSHLRENVRRGCKTLYLSSPGGSVETALTLGRIIRNAEMTVVIQGEGKCASACVFLYAGGVTRAPYGPVLIHRPYLDGSSASFEETQRRFAEIGKRAKSYLREVNVSESLFDRMMTIAPENSVAMPLDEMDVLGLGFNDQVYLEYLENKKAARAGMTKKGWLAKKQQTIEICGALIGAVVPAGELESRRKCWDRRFPEYFPATE